MLSVAGILDPDAFLAVVSMIAGVNPCGRSNNGFLVVPIFRLNR